MCCGFRTMLLKEGWFNCIRQHCITVKDPVEGNHILETECFVAESKQATDAVKTSKVPFQSSPSYNSSSAGTSRGPPPTENIGAVDTSSGSLQDFFKSDLSPGRLPSSGSADMQRTSDVSRLSGKQCHLLWHGFWSSHAEKPSYESISFVCHAKDFWDLLINCQSW